MISTPFSKNNEFLMEHLMIFISGCTHFKRFSACGVAITPVMHDMNEEKEKNLRFFSFSSYISCITGVICVGAKFGTIYLVAYFKT